MALKTWLKKQGQLYGALKNPVFFFVQISHISQGQIISNCCCSNGNDRGFSSNSVHTSYIQAKVAIFTANHALPKYMSSLLMRKTPWLFTNGARPMGLTFGTEFEESTQPSFYAHSQCLKITKNVAFELTNFFGIFIHFLSN